MSYNSQFIANPQAFAQKYSLIPYCSMQVNQAHMKDLALSDGSHFTEVRGDNKVAFCDIRPATSFSYVPGDLGGSYHEYKGLLVLHITSDSPHSGAFPVYYLPWNTDQMFRIKLKPSPHHAKKTETWFFGLAGGDTIVPNIFITAAVQGCSVFVRGDPESPVVYHVNASSSNPLSGATLRSADDMQFLEAAQHKATRMTQWTALAQLERPKEGPKLLTGQRGAPARSFSGQTHLTDYMPGMLPAFLSRHQQNYAHLLGIPATDVEVQQFGTVFGFRAERDWVFYYQTRTALSYRRDGVWHDEFRDPVCLKFWPT